MMISPEGRLSKKAAFILKACGVRETARRRPVDAVPAVEKSISSLARSIYSRSSISTRLAARSESADEAYADAVLVALPQIHDSSGAKRTVQNCANVDGTRAVYAM